MRLIIPFIILYFLFLSYSCKKKMPVEPVEETVTTEMQGGLPENSKNINGYFYAMNRFEIDNRYYYYHYASFSDPERSLMKGYNHYQNLQISNPTTNSGNIDVGSVSLNASPPLLKSVIPSSGMVLYRLTLNSQIAPLGPSAKWTIEGNKSFTPLETEVAGGFPVIKSTYTVNTINKSAGFVFNVTDNVSNYDSIVVRFYLGPNESVKRGGANTGSLSFSPAELSNVSAGSGFLYICL